MLYARITWHREFKRGPGHAGGIPVLGRIVHHGGEVAERSRHPLVSMAHAPEDSLDVLGARARGAKTHGNLETMHD